MKIVKKQKNKNWYHHFI